MGARSSVFYLPTRCVHLTRQKNNTRQGTGRADCFFLTKARGIFSFVAFVPDSVLQKESEDQSYLKAKWDEKGSSKDLVQMYQVCKSLFLSRL